MNTIGFIGMGNMAKAIASGIIGKGLMEGDHVYAYAPHYDKLADNAKKIGFVPCGSLKELVRKSEVIIMACKPYQIEEVLKEIREDLKGKAIVSIAAGWPCDRYLSLVDETTRVQFVMPNTPVMVGEGVMLFEEKNTLEKEERQQLWEMFATLGLVTELPTKLMDVGSALIGCAPAFMDMVMEALGDAGVKYGVPRAQAYQLVAQMMLGSAKLQIKTGEHPGVLKDQVCSPAGTTIRGVDALEHAGLRAAFIDAVDAVVK